MSQYLLALVILCSGFTARAEVDELEPSEVDGAEIHGAEVPADGVATRGEPLPDTPVKPSTKADVGALPATEKESSASGEKIFDWSKHQGEKEVAHPFAEKGLIRITKDRTYIYKTEESDQKRAASFALGVFEPSSLENPDSDGPGNKFEDNYDQTNSPAIMFNYEWQFWQSAIGKWGLRVGTGAYIAQGNGHFNSAGPNAAKTPREIFTFFAMPNSVGMVYRMQFWDKQLFVPYAEGGGIAFTFGEVRDDDKGPKFGASAAAYVAAGLAFNLTYFDNISRIQLDREYGINRVYLTAEYRTIMALTTRYDFSSDLINGGFLMEF